MMNVWPCAPRMRAQMILASVTGLLDSSSRMCGTEPDVLPPLQPPAFCFQPLQDLLQFVMAGGAYELITLATLVQGVGLQQQGGSGGLRQGGGPHGQQGQQGGGGGGGGPGGMPLSLALPLGALQQHQHHQQHQKLHHYHQAELVMAGQGGGYGSGDGPGTGAGRPGAPSRPGL
jgi:hypothetical protein